MQMLKAIIRPEREPYVIRALERIGVFALTKVPVTGRGRQGGAEVEGLGYSELSKVMLLVVLEDDRVDETVTTIAHSAYTGYPGDGRIFVTAVDKAVRLRTGEIYQRASGGEATR